MASAAIHGLLVTLWFNQVGSGSNEALHKETVLELVTIEELSEKSTVSPQLASTIAKELPKKLREHIPVQKYEAAQAETVAVNLAVNQQIRPPAEAFKPEPAITTAESKLIDRENEERRSKDSNATTSLVRSHLESFKFYPASARRRGVEGHVDVAFILKQNGAADQITVLQGSGYSLLDRAAIQTVSRAQPFPVDDGTYRFRLRFKRL